MAAHHVPPPWRVFAAAAVAAAAGAMLWWLSFAAVRRWRSHRRRTRPDPPPPAPNPAAADRWAGTAPSRRDPCADARPAGWQAVNATEACAQAASAHARQHAAGAPPQKGAPPRRALSG
eukprot:gene3831-2815_t